MNRTPPNSLVTDSLPQPAEETNGDSLVVIGWREYVALPAWGIRRLKAKADTGARTSALDVANLEELDGDLARFEIVVDRSHPNDRMLVEAPIIRRSRVKSSLGTVHLRPVVETEIRIGPVKKTIHLGLVCRKNMLCRMLLGRLALAPEFVVDPSARYRFDHRPRKKKRSTRSS